MTIAIRCDLCRAKFDVDDGRAGHRVQCPRCSEWSRAPITATPALHRCPSCGAQSAFGAAFCPACGVALHAEQAATCPSCGSSVPSGAGFCPRCGFSLRGDMRRVPLASHVSDLEGARPKVLMERTAKKYKLAQLVGGLVTMLGIVIMTAPGGIDSWCGRVGLALTLIGVIGLCVARFVIWWEHE